LRTCSARKPRSKTSIATSWLDGADGAVEATGIRGGEVEVRPASGFAGRRDAAEIGRFPLAGLLVRAWLRDLATLATEAVALPAVTFLAAAGRADLAGRADALTAGFFDEAAGRAGRGLLGILGA
jgi:hypothetical protein